MAARAMWKAVVVLDSLRVPVRLYAALQDRNIHFRLLHGKDNTPVVQQMVDPVRKEVVPSEEIRKGIEVEPGVFVLLSEQELTDLEPEESREIVIEQVVERGQVDERWFDRPYFLGPDGDVDRYFALAEAMASDDSICISRWTMRKKQYVGALHSSDGYLMLESLRFAEEMVQLEKLRPAPSREPDNREIALAEQLIAALEDEFDPHAYADAYREDVLKLIDSKAKGKILKFPKAKTVKSSRSLADDLEASLKATRSTANAT